MTWGGLNPALTSWRNGVNALFPHRGIESDGGYADGNHSGQSQHQADPDGTVDAFDEDVNFLGSGIPTGNAVEKRIKVALNKDFKADRRSHLVICDRTISNRDIDNWRVRDYFGQSPHDHHTHREADPKFEKDGRPWDFNHTVALLNELNGLDMDEKTVRSIIQEELKAFFLATGEPSSPQRSSRIGRDALGQAIPNPFAGTKTPAWALLGDIANALKAATEPPVDPAGK